MVRISTLIWFVLSIVTGSLLFNYSQKAADTKEAVMRLERQIAFEKQTLNVLEAEWSYLNRPSRLQILANTHLNLQERPRIIVLNDDLSHRLSPPPAPVYRAPPAPTETIAVNTTAEAKPDIISYHPPQPEPVSHTTSAPQKTAQSFEDLLLKIGVE